MRTPKLTLSELKLGILALREIHQGYFAAIDAMYLNSTTTTIDNHVGSANREQPVCLLL
jgi:hypothetical protein